MSYQVCQTPPLGTFNNQKGGYDKLSVSALFYYIQHAQKQFNSAIGTRSELPPIEMSGFKVKSPLGMPLARDGLNPL